MHYCNTQLSVALVTRNRPESLERTLISLRAQSVQPWEVIVSDDSDDEMAEEVERIVSCYGGCYQRGPRHGLYANRNHVAQACRGTHIRTMDDDHEFPVGHMEQCLAAVDSDPTSVWIIGEFLPHEQATAGIPFCPGQLHPRGFSVEPPDTQHCWAISDGASIYPKGVFESGQQYIEDYKFGAAYLEFGSRLHWRGYRIRHLAATYVIHHYDPQTRSFLNLEIDLSSRFCAMLCHVYIYQPSRRNKLLCHLEIGKQLLLQGRVAARSLILGYAGWRKQQSVLSRGQAPQT